jgi:ribosomal protein S12
MIVVVATAALMTSTTKRQRVTRVADFIGRRPCLRKASRVRLIGE